MTQNPSPDPNQTLKKPYNSDPDCFRRIGQLLRLTRTTAEKERLDPDLAKLTDAYFKSEEERLEKSLKSVGWNIDLPTTVSLITGAGRIQRVC